MREKSGEWKMIKIYYMKKIVQLGGDKHRALEGGNWEERREQRLQLGCKVNKQITNKYSAVRKL